MTFFRILFIPVLLFSTKLPAQQHVLPASLVGKIFISKELDYLKVLNDTTIYSSFTPYTDTSNLFLSNDTLFIKQRYRQSDHTGTKTINTLYDYTVVSLSSDTIQLKSNRTFNNKPAPVLLFVNIEKLKEPVEEFRYLTIDYASPWSGKRHVSIDSLGKVNFIDDPILYSPIKPQADKNAKPSAFAGQLTAKEFMNFKNLLSKSLPSKLPLLRSCGIDDSKVQFKIVIGKQTIKSYGCELSWTHSFLLNYLYGLDKNPGCIKKK